MLFRSDGMLARLDSSVPDGTRLVILQPGTNDGRRGSSAGAAVNVPLIIQKLRARGIKVIMAHMSSGASEIGPDGQHLTARGNSLVAANLLPQVIGAIGKR